MALKPRVTDLQQRERRQRGYAASRTISERFPRVRELVFELRFKGEAGKPLLSPYKQIYTGDMQAFFELQCPSRECAGGGFDLSTAADRAAGSHDGISHGLIKCRGVAQGSACVVELQYEIVAFTT
ncbi:hypothetical protein [Hydrocarboniphaga effusa]|jgi:hypothetical protein|uniref:hypothetical protein n=1 Tax=Hydrocarboniphaga effusa TaxID=243629 RepID=UPI0026CA5C75